MNIIIVTFLILLRFSATNLLSSEASKIDRNLVKFIVDWGYFENYHPLLVSNEIDADSLFCQISNGIIKNKTTYSAENLLINLNTKLAFPLSSHSSLYKNLCDEKAFRNNPSSLVFNDSIVRNKRVIFNESTSQFIFHTSVKNSQPFPNAPLRLLGLAKIWNNYKFYYPYQETLPKNKAYKHLLTKYIRVILDCNNFSEYHLSIQKFISEFRDTHSKAKSFIIGNQFGIKTIPAKVRYIDGSIIVHDYYDKCLLDASALKIGDIILKVNGESILNIFKLIKPYIAYSNSASLYRELSKISLKTNQDSMNLLIKRERSCFLITVPTYNILDLSNRERIKKKDNSLVNLNDSTLYIKCAYVDTLDLRSTLLNNRQLKWFIFDLRSSTEWIKSIIDDFFVETKTIFANYYLPLPSNPGWFSELKPLTIGPSIQELQIKNPHVIILVNENTQSQGEFQTMFLQAIPKSVTIGSQTAGADGNTSEFIIPGNITIVMTLLGVEYPTGKKTQRFGVKIDYYLSPNLEDAKQGIDQEMKCANEIIKKGG